MIISTTKIDGKKQILGPVYATVAKTHHAIKHLSASLKRITGGNLNQEKETLEMAIKEAITRLEEEAKKMKADAVEGLKIETNIDINGAWVVVYGTAIKR